MCNIKRVCVDFQAIKGPFPLLFLDLWLCPAATNLPLKVCLDNKKHAGVDGFQVEVHVTRHAGLPGHYSCSEPLCWSVAGLEGVPRSGSEESKDGSMLTALSSNIPP